MKKTSEMFESFKRTFKLKQYGSNKRSLFNKKKRFFLISFFFSIFIRFFSVKISFLFGFERFFCVILYFNICIWIFFFQFSFVFCCTFSIFYRLYFLTFFSGVCIFSRILYVRTSILRKLVLVIFLLLLLFILVLGL